MLALARLRLAASVTPGTAPALSARRIVLAGLALILAWPRLVTSPATNTASLTQSAPVQPAPALPDSTAAAPQIPAPGAAPVAPRAHWPAELAGRPEVVALRTAHTATYLLDGGRLVSVLDTTPLHYQTPDGSWQPINAAFAAVAGGFVNATNTLQLSVAAANGQARLTSAAVGLGWEPRAVLAVDQFDREQTVAEPLAASRALPGVRSADGRTLAFPGAWSLAGLQETWQTSAGAAEYRLRLDTPPAAAGAPAALDLAVRVTLRPGTTVRVDGQPAALPLDTDRALEFTGAAGGAVTLYPPAAVDAAQARTPGRYRVTATAEPGVVELRVRFPWVWLAAPERRYPVLLDPLFEVKSGTELRRAVYAEDGSFKRLDPGADGGVLGWLSDTDNSVVFQRLLARFELPSMPAGTRVERAYLLARPERVLPGGYAVMTVDLRAFEPASGDWRAGLPPDLAAARPLPSPNSGLLLAQDHLSVVAAHWDITALAQDWARVWDNPTDPALALLNTGLLLELGPVRCLPGCDGVRAGLRFPAPSRWPTGDLASAQSFQDAASPYVLTDGSGLRLMVYSAGPTLLETSAAGENVAVVAGTPSDDPNDYQAEHEFRLTTTPDRWQALAVRGRGREAVDPLDADNRLVPVQGAFNVGVRAADGARLADLAAERGLAYGVFRAPAAQTYSARVSAMAAVPSGYDARLVGQDAQAIAVAADTSQTREYLIRSDSPLTLIGLDLPAGTRARVDVAVVEALDVENASRHSAQAAGFLGRLYTEAAGLAAGGVRLNANNDTGLGQFRLSSGPFPVDATAAALALAYTGPAITTPIPPPIIHAPESGGDESQAVNALSLLTFRVKVTVTACGTDPFGNPAFPTADGQCQVLKCPTSTAGYGAAGPFGVWRDPGAADLLGPASDLSAPTIGVIGGRVAADGSVGPSAEFGDAAPDTVLIRCGPAADPNPLLAYLPVFQAPLTVQGARLAPATHADPALLNAWPLDDRADLTSRAYFADPNAGTAGGTAALRRDLGAGPQVAAADFAVAWTLTADGWPTLIGSAAQTGGGAPTVAGLSVDLGTAFSLSSEPARGAYDERAFTGLVAGAGRVTQPAAFGGASQPVQAVLLPRGRALPEAGGPCRDSAGQALSCLDLRSPANLLDRHWTMPDVHLTGPAATVAVGVPGALHVYSTDHPLGAEAQAAAASFSYDTFGARVSVTQESCEAGGPAVTVVRGETLMALPNVGASGDPADLLRSSFKLCATSLREVLFQFKSTVGVPLGNSGLFLTGAQGEVKLAPAFTTITFGLDFQAASGADGGLLKGTGTVTLDTRGLFAFNGQFGLLKGYLSGSGDLWVSWSPLDLGLKAQVNVPAREPWLTATLRGHIWTGRGWGGRYAWLPDDDQRHIAAELTARLRLPEAAVLDWGPLEIPPDDVELLGIDLAFGQFCTNAACTEFEWGLKGKFPLLGYDIGLYYSFGRDLTDPDLNPGRLAFNLGNDGYVLIDQYAGASAVPAAAPASTAAPVAITPPPPVTDGTAIVSLTVNAGVEQILVGLGWWAGAPQLTLIDPNGVAVTPANAPAFSAEISATLTSTLIGVRAPQPGQWQARLSNLSPDRVENYKFVFLANRGAPVKAGAPLLLTPALPDSPGTGFFRVRWQVPAGVSDQARLNLYALGPVPGNKLVPDTDDIGVPIALHVPLRDGAYNWSTVGWPNGTYQVYAVMEDGVADSAANNAADLCVPLTSALPDVSAFDPARFPGALRFLAAGTVKIDDQAAPPTPSGLTLTPGDSALLAEWPASTDPYVVAYLVEWGPPENVRAQRVAAERAPALRLGGLDNGVSVPVRVAAVRVNGTVSAFSPDVSAAPDAAIPSLPTPPTELSATHITATSLTLAWTPAAGAPPDGYRVTYTRLGRTGETGALTTLETGAELTGLTTGAVYEVRVNAHSAAWNGLRSEPLRVLITSGTDADGDGLPDDWAAAFAVTGADADADGDGLTNAQEFAAATAPTLQDSDGDALSDAEEVNSAGLSDPLDALSAQAYPWQPRLTLSERRLRFVVDLDAGGAVPTQTVGWANSGGGALALQAAAQAPWLIVGAGADTVAISVDKARLAQPGFYSGVLRLTPAPGSDALIGPPACVRVDVWAFAKPKPSGGDGGRVTRGLQALYTFEEGRGALVRDVSGAGTALNLTIGDSGAVRWVAGGLVIRSGTQLVSTAPAGKLVEAANRSQEFTLEAWVRPATSGRERGSLFALAKAPATVALALGQVRDRFALFQVASGRTVDWLATPGQAASGALLHIVYTRDQAGMLRAYVNGVEVARRDLGSRALGWDASLPLTLANVPGGRFPWLGEFQLAAFYGRRLSAAEVQRNFNAGPGGAQK